MAFLYAHVLPLHIAGFRKLEGKGGLAVYLGGAHNGYFPGGDHVPFYEMEVPRITVVRAGVHPHFHQSFYNVDTIKPEVVKMAT
jgi:hypothetical protein